MIPITKILILGFRPNIGVKYLLYNYIYYIGVLCKFNNVFI